MRSVCAAALAAISLLIAPAVAGAQGTQTGQTTTTPPPTAPPPATPPPTPVKPTPPPAAPRPGPARGLDFSVGYAVLHDSELATTFPAGWVAAFSDRVDRRFSVVGEVGGHYKTQTTSGVQYRDRIHAFLGGVRVGEYRRWRVAPFGQVLVGAAHLSQSALGLSASDTVLAIQPGVGVEVPGVVSNVGLRGQVDYRWLHRGDIGASASEIRASLSVVIPWPR